MKLPAVIPVMLLPKCNVLPQGLLPLYIFEPRYRAMLQYALQTDRLLCVGTLTPSREEQMVETDELIHEFSTAAVIRACVRNADGTSHLVLQGLQRVRLVSWEQYEPFRIARIDPLEDRISDAGSAGRKKELLLARVLGLIRQDTDAGRQLAGQLQQLDDPAGLADFVAGHLIPDALKRQPLLGMPEVGERLDYLLDLLQAGGQNRPGSG